MRRLCLEYFKNYTHAHVFITQFSRHLLQVHVNRTTTVFSIMISIRSTAARCSLLQRLQPSISTFQRRSACSKSRTSTHCSSKAVASLPFSSTQFWSSTSIWKRAGINTLRCLIGCTAGDFSAMWYLQSFHADLGLSTIMALSSMLAPVPRDYLDSKR